jgi:hypothetical protein
LADLSREETEAAFQISFARQSSAFSRRSLFNSADSSLVRPGRLSSSIWACRTQVRSISAAPTSSLVARR